MKKKILIGVAIFGVVALLALLIFGGGSTIDKTVTQHEINNTIDKIVCAIDGEDNIEYEMEILSNDRQFDSEIQAKKYTKISIAQKKNFKTYGIAFVVMSQDNSSLNFELMKNDEVLTSMSVSLKGAEVNYADLILQEAVEITTADELYVRISGNTEFVFDSLIMLFEE